LRVKGVAAPQSQFASFGRFQKVLSVAFICFFSFGSQLFQAIPFYTLLPRLNCHIQKTDLTFEVIQDCPKALACNLPKPHDFYAVDWTAPTSLQNWMTDFDLICEPPFRIGLIGTLQFIGLAAGALLFTPLSDVYGRKPVLAISAALTPLVIVVFLFFAKSLDAIYFWIVVLSLSYSCQGLLRLHYGAGVHQEGVLALLRLLLVRARRAHGDVRGLFSLLDQKSGRVLHFPWH